MFICILEGFPQYQAELKTLLAAIDNGSIDACTSELTMAEVLLKPIAERNEARRKAFETLLTSPRIRLCQVTRGVLIQAAELRAKHESLKLPDAIHVGTAMEEDCSSFLTNDTLAKVNEVAVVLLAL